MDKFPSGILNRKKMGFSIPLDSWFRNELKNMSYDLIVSSTSLKHGYFRKAPIEDIWNLHQKGIRNYGTQLWIILMFEMWYKKYMSQS